MKVGMHGSYQYQNNNLKKKKNWLTATPDLVVI